jgi:hypothetical protein
MLLAAGLSFAADPNAVDLWNWGTEKASGVADFFMPTLSAAEAPDRGDSPSRVYGRPHQPFRGPQSKLGYIQSELEHAGYSHDQAQAVMKNMNDESGFDENAIGDRGTAFGIAQWRGDRAENMEAHVADQGLSRFEGQVGFLIKELADYNLSPQQMPEDFASAYNAVMEDYEKPAEQYARERRIPRGTPAPGGETPAPVRDARNMSGIFIPRGNRPTSVETIARGRTEPTVAAAEEGGALTPTAVVAPQTTNNFFDNRSTNIMRPALDARNREAGVVALQNLQGLTAALG